MKPTLLIAALALTLGCQVQHRPDVRRTDPVLRRVKDLPARGVAEYAASVEVPMMNLPVAARQKNWLVRGQGSCVIASFCSVLRWQGRDDLAKIMRSRYGAGHWSDQLNRELDTEKIRYAYTTNGSVAFLDWAMRTRRGAMITFHQSHACSLAHLDGKIGLVLNNNNVAHLERYSRADFIRRWRMAGGWACVPVFAPPPPLNPADR